MTVINENKVRMWVFYLTSCSVVNRAWSVASDGIIAVPHWRHARALIESTLRLVICSIIKFNGDIREQPV